MATESRRPEIYSEHGIPEGERAKILACIVAASEARKKARPACSRFAVGAALLTASGEIAAGCNYEYGGGFGSADTRGVHAEQSAIAQALMQCSQPLKIQIVAVVADSPRPFCCGNCLDSIMSYSDEHLSIAACGLDGSVTLKRIDDVFPREFERIPMSELSPQHAALVERALQSRFSSFQLFPASPAGLSGAAALGTSGNVYSGVREDTASFHPVSAIEAALVSSRIHGDPRLAAVAFVSENGYLAGRDRQKIFERADCYDMLDDLTVLNYAVNRPVVEVCKARELLPFGFGIKSFK